MDRFSDQRPEPVDRFLVQLALPPLEVGLEFLGRLGMGSPQPSFPEALGGLGDFFQRGEPCLGIDQIQTTSVKGDVFGPFRLRSGPEQGVHAGGGGYSGAPHAFTAALNDAFQSRKRSD